MAECCMWGLQIGRRPKCLYGPDIEPLEGWFPFIDTDGITKRSAAVYIS